MAKSKVKQQKVDDAIKKLGNIEIVDDDKVKIKRDKEKYTKKLSKMLQDIRKKAKQNDKKLTYEMIDKYIPQEMSDLIDSDFIEKLYTILEEDGI